MSKVLIPFRSNEHGFTLLEMMIVLSIIGTVFALAIPNYLQWNRTYQLRQATTDLHGSLTLARMTAMNRNTTVTMTLGAIPCPPKTTYCGTIGASFAGIISPVPLQSRKITSALTTGGTTVQLSSLGLRIGEPVPPGDQNQYITLTNTRQSYLFRCDHPGGKIRWCAASTCT